MFSNITGTQLIVSVHKGVPCATNLYWAGFLCTDLLYRPEFCSGKPCQSFLWFQRIHGQATFEGLFSFIAHINVHL